MINHQNYSEYGSLARSNSKRQNFSLSFQSETIESLENYFLGQYSSKEINLFNNWEYTIVFKNPDKNPKSLGIAYEEALKIFKNTCVNPPSDYEKAFENAFQQLSEAHSGKILDGGGKLNTNPENAYIETGQKAKDFLTLIRNIVQYILECVLHFKTMLVLSSDGENIYLLISSDDECMLEEAQNTEYNLQMKVSMVDSLSLEPCDKNLRPLRFLRTKNEKIKEMLMKIWADKKLNWLPDSSNKYNHRGVSSAQWDAYAEYLELLYNRLDKGEDYCKLTQKCKTIINRRRDKKHALKNLWDRLGFAKPIGPYCDFSHAYPIEIWKSTQALDSSKKVLLRNVDVLKMIPSYIGRKLSLDYLKSKNIIQDFYPLHNYHDLSGSMPKPSMSMFSNYSQGIKIKKKDLIYKWPSSFFNTNLPLNHIRKYFGEKIGLYFAFITLYGDFLAIPSLVGIGVFIIQRLYSPYYYIVIILNAFYSIYMTAIAITLLEAWKRKQTTLSIEWGQTDFEQDEVPRPQYKGTFRRSPINDDLEEIFYSHNRRRAFYAIGLLVTIFILILVISTLTGILILRKQLTNNLIVYGIDFSGILCSIMNAMQIQVFNFIFEKVVIRLNRMENHRTQSEYNNALIIKTYLFQFVNSFSSLYYIAFIKTNWDGCLVDDGKSWKYVLGANCMDELYLQLLCLFVILFLKNIIEICGPVIRYKLKVVKVKEYVGWNYIEKLREELDGQFFLASYDEKDSDGTLEDFLELAIMFGYITLFAVAFPLSSFLTYLAILLEKQVDRFKLLYLVRRPQPLGSNNIGIWQGIFTFNCTAAIFTNVGIICFTIPALEHWELAANNIYLTYTLSVLVLISFQWLLQVSIPDIPANYSTLLKRHKNIIEKKLHKSKQYFRSKTHKSMPNFTIYIEDFSHLTTII